MATQNVDWKSETAQVGLRETLQFNPRIFDDHVQIEILKVWLVQSQPPNFTCYARFNKFKAIWMRKIMINPGIWGDLGSSFLIFIQTTKNSVPQVPRHLGGTERAKLLPCAVHVKPHRWGRHQGWRLPTSIGSCSESFGQDILCVCVCETGTHTHNN